MKETKIAVIGGDRRSLAAAAVFKQRCGAASVWGFDRCEDASAGGAVLCSSLCASLADADAVMLGLPASTDGVRVNCPLSSRELKLSELFALLSPDTPVFGGHVTDEVYDAASEHGIKIYDYYDREELCVLNALPTAEGAAAIAINELPTTLHSSNVLVLGYGRTAKVLCRTLKALGALVTACARKPSDHAWMKTEGICAADICTLECPDARPAEGTANAAQKLMECDILFNTVPVRLLTRTALSLLRPGTPVIDLASKPGGVDFDAAREIGTNVIWALSLPGKTAPVTAGRVTADTVLTMLGELETENDT